VILIGLIGKLAGSKSVQDFLANENQGIKPIKPIKVIFFVFVMKNIKLIRSRRNEVS
jgi:hypothetical protein